MESSDPADDLESVAAQEYAELLSAVFGDSDTDEDSNDQHCREEEVGSESNDGYLWEKVEDVEGLWHCSHFLSLKQQTSLSEAIYSEGWFCDPLHNQAMRFGDLPGWAKDLSTFIQSRSGGQSSGEALGPQEPDQYSQVDGPNEARDSTSPFPSWILEREPLFDQMIVNSYQPGEVRYPVICVCLPNIPNVQGIAAHVDLLRFEDGIAIVSLESSCVMSFRIVNNPAGRVEDASTRKPVLDSSHDSCLVGPDRKETPHSSASFCRHLQASGTIPQAMVSKSQSHICEQNPSGGVAKVDVLLNPGDLIIAYGPARYDWTHEINRSEDNQLWRGQPIVQQRRVSVTLRRLCSQKDVQ